MSTPAAIAPVLVGLGGLLLAAGCGGGTTTRPVVASRGAAAAHAELAEPFVPRVLPDETHEGPEWRLVPIRIAAGDGGSEDEVAVSVLQLHGWPSGMGSSPHRWTLDQVARESSAVADAFEVSPGSRFDLPRILCRGQAVVLAASTRSESAGAWVPLVGVVPGAPANAFPDELVLPLIPAARVRGRVVSRTGRSVSGLDVRVGVGSSERLWGSWRVIAWLAAATDADGNFESVLLPRTHATAIPVEGGELRGLTLARVRVYRGDALCGEMQVRDGWADDLPVVVNVD